jgi:integrase
LAEANAVAERMEIELLNHGREAFGELTSLQRKDALEAFRILAPFPGTSLAQAAQTLARELEAAARKASGPSVKAALEAFLTAKKVQLQAGSLRKLSFKDLQSKTRYLLAEFGEQPLASLDVATMEEFLGRLTVGQRTRENIRIKCGEFLNFAVRRKWLTENPVRSLGKKIESRDVEILTVSATRDLLRAAERSPYAANVIPYLVTSLFAGLRPSEAMRLQWQQVHLETAQIEILKSTTKTRETRFVSISPLLARWLIPYRKKSGPIVTANFLEHWRAVRAAAGYGPQSPWPVDVLRHSFGSYHLAVHQNRAELSELMGNSPAIIRRHYRRAIPRQLALEYWEIEPALQLGNVLPFHQVVG